MKKYIDIEGLGNQKGYLIDVVDDVYGTILHQAQVTDIASVLAKAERLALIHPVVLNQEIYFKPNPEDRKLEKLIRKALADLSTLVNKKLLDLYSSIPVREFY
jgi:fructose-1,6-bisphosphatase/sedoheptulose 1,7-bisphosphatase-like protein